jgi:hypothetical protein
LKQPGFQKLSHLVCIKKVFVLITFCFVNFQCYAADEIDFFALPSPNEIIADAESQGLKVKLSRESIQVIKLDLDALVKDQPVLTSYHVGRIFAVAGYGFKKLNNDMILKLAEKVLKAMKQMDLPEVILNEINDYYDLMVSKKQWDRNELMLSFTSARASLLYLLKDSKKIEPEDQKRVQSYASALEYGIWFQSLDLALDSLESGQNEAFHSVYLDEDFLGYFESLAKRESSPLFNAFKTYNQTCIDTIKDDLATNEEIAQLKTDLKQIVEGEVK